MEEDIDDFLSQLATLDPTETDSGTLSGSPPPDTIQEKPVPQKSTVPASLVRIQPVGLRPVGLHPVGLRPTATFRPIQDISHKHQTVAKHDSVLQLEDDEELIIVAPQETFQKNTHIHPSRQHLINTNITQISESIPKEIAKIVDNEAKIVLPTVYPENVDNSSNDFIQHAAPPPTAPWQGPSKRPFVNAKVDIMQQVATANMFDMLNSRNTKNSEEIEDGKPKKHLRCAAGKIWNDITLEDWPENDYRIFVGNLGNDVTDELLSKFFSHYSSFAKARVVRDRTGKPRGYGFASLLQPREMARALREMEGKYCGSRPVMLKRAQTEKRDYAANKDTFERTKKNHSY